MISSSKELKKLSNDVSHDPCYHLKFLRAVVKKWLIVNFLNFPHGTTSLKAKSTCLRILYKKCYLLICCYWGLIHGMHCY